MEYTKKGSQAGLMQSWDEMSPAGVKSLSKQDISARAAPAEDISMWLRMDTDPQQGTTSLRELSKKEMELGWALLSRRNWISERRGRHWEKAGEGEV